MKANLFNLEQERLVLLDNLQELVFKLKLDGSFFYVNPSWSKILQYEEWEALKMNFSDILPTEQIGKWHKIRQRLAHGLAYSSMEFIFKAKNDKRVNVGGCLHLVLEDDESIIGIFEDVTSRKRVETERDRLFALSIDMLSIIGYDRYLKRVNPAFQKTLGFSDEDFLQKPFMQFVYPEDRLKTLEEFSKLEKGIPSVNFENRCLHKDGGYRWLSWTGHPVESERCIYAVARDVTQEHKLKETLKKMAFTDALTGLYNRRSFFIVGERMLKIANRKKMGFLLMMADLDDMKSINDEFGHTEGDSALIATAEIFRKRFRDSDVVARIGGDEFIAGLLINGADHSRTIQSAVEKSVENYNYKKSSPYKLSLSMGFAYAHSGLEVSLKELIGRADKAMYEVKKNHLSPEHSIK